MFVRHAKCWHSHINSDPPHPRERGDAWRHSYAVQPGTALNQARMHRFLSPSTAHVITHDSEDLYPHIFTTSVLTS